jgi:S-methylmethionine-dependent homocysteine/selenocysteine methylase
VVLDGGLATALESHGQDLADPLWSARVLLEAPDLVRRVHMDYLAAGADCIATVTYQATFEGFTRRGLTDAEAGEAFHLAVRLALEARDDFWSEAGNRQGRLRPLVAASVGPYGAFLADGSEYTGAYDLDEAGLTAFHRRRWNLLAGSGVDLLACETIPSLVEARALLGLLSETAGRWAWLSFQCRDEARLADGTPLVEAVRALLFPGWPPWASTVCHRPVSRPFSPEHPQWPGACPSPPIPTPGSGMTRARSPGTRRQRHGRRVRRRGRGGVWVRPSSAGAAAPGRTPSRA